MSPPVFPFHDVVGQDEAKLGLLLVAVDPRIGGVLLRGDKGSAKTTLARGLAGLLDEAPFVELPLGATEDRLVGTLDTAAALMGDGFRFRPGLLAEAHGGILYVDEINLLADHLVDTLLDVTVSGENVVERDGISHRHPSRFVLVGSMNPEEGELRPQLLDRFGLCIEMAAPIDIATRVAALHRRLSFDGHPLGELAAAPADPSATPDSDIEARADRLEAAGPALTSVAMLHAAARLAVEVGAEGLRADLTLCRAAAALAGLDGRDAVDLDDLRQVAPLVLSHRSRRGPFDPPTLDSDELDRAMSEALGDPQGEADLPGNQGDDATTDAQHDDGDHDTSTGEGDDAGGPDGPAPGGGKGANAADEPLLTVAARRHTSTPPRRQAPARRGRVVRDLPVGADRPVAVAPTVRALASRRTTDPTAALQPDDLRSELRVAPQRRTIVLCVDLSGSMGATRRAEAATGTVLGLLADAYQRRDRVALVGFRNIGAEVLLAPTSSVEVARNRLEDLVTGGETPLAEGIACALDVALTAARDGADVVLAVLTDGRATGRPDALDTALDCAATVRRRGITALVIDCETGAIRLGLAKQLADAMGARHVVADELDPESLGEAIRTM